MGEAVKALNFQAALRLLPHAERLKFTVKTIENQPADSRKASLNKLHTLVLSGAKTDEEMLEFIQRSALHLSNLTLKNSLLISKILPHQRIRMPKIAFSTLLPIGKWESYEMRDIGQLPENSIHACWTKPQAPIASMLVQVTALATKRPAQYFVLSVD